MHEPNSISIYLNIDVLNKSSLVVAGMPSSEQGRKLGLRPNLDKTLGYDERPGTQHYTNIESYF